MLTYAGILFSFKECWWAVSEDKFCNRRAMDYSRCGVCAVVTHRRFQADELPRWLNC